MKHVSIVLPKRNMGFQSWDQLLESDRVDLTVTDAVCMCIMLSMHAMLVTDGWMLCGQVWYAGSPMQFVCEEMCDVDCSSGYVMKKYQHGVVMEVWLPMLVAWAPISRSHSLRMCASLCVCV